MKKWVGLLIAVFALHVAAQTTTVTATVVDSDSTAWANGTVSWQYYPATLSGLTDTRTGQPITPKSGSVTLDGSGNMSLTGITPSQYINPLVTGLSFTVCPSFINARCYTTPPISIGSTTPQNVSTQINASIQAPRITGGIISQAYADIEVLPVNGNQYYNVISNTNRCYTNGAWGACGGATGGVTSINANSGAFTFNGQGVSCTATTCTFTGGAFTSIIAPSGDATGGTDCGVIQTACTNTANIQLTAGTFYLGKSNTACTISHTCSITGTGIASTIIQNEGTTNDVLVFNAPNITGSDLPPYTYPLPNGGIVGGFTIQEDPSLTATAGAGERVGTNGSNTTANYIFYNTNIANTYRGIQVDPGFWNNHFINMVLWNMASTDCIFYDSPAPNGDNVFQNMMLVGSSSSHLCNINWERADTGRANLIKFNNGKMIFGTANQSNIFASDVSIEGPPDCALDFSAGTSANYGVYNFSNFEFEVGTTGLTPNPVCAPANAPGLNIRGMCLGAVAGSAGKCFNGPSYSPNWVPLALQSYDSFGGGNNVPFVPSATNYIQGWAQMNTTAWSGLIYFNGNNQVGNSATLSHISAYYTAFTPLTLAHTVSVYCGLDTSGGGWCDIGANSSSQSASGFNGYGCRLTQGTGVLLERWDAGTNTQLGSTETSVTSGFHKVSITSTLTHTYTCSIDGTASTHATATDSTYGLGNPWIALNPATNAYYLQYPFEVQ